MIVAITEVLKQLPGLRRAWAGYTPRSTPRTPMGERRLITRIGFHITMLIAILWLFELWRDVVILTVFKRTTGQSV